MCGIVGAFYQRGSITPFAGILDSGLKAMWYRGPDNQSSITHESAYLGQARLSIIDLTDAANQPMKSVNDEAWIIFSGEIYNYKQLRRTLVGDRKLRTTSDTEILLEGYLKHGMSFFKQLRGIYAFAIYDLRGETKMIVGRDPGGIKPLYYSYKDGLFAFGSEIKSFMKAVPGQLTPNETVVKTYLHFTYCLEPGTAYNEIRALEPGTAAVITQNEIKYERIYSYDFSRRNGYTYQENLEALRPLLKQAVERNMTADVPVSVALSGGIDSSLIYAYGLKTNPDFHGLTVQFDDSVYNEADVAQAFSEHLKGKNTVVSFKESFNLEKLNEILLQYDQPYADTSALALYVVSKAARPFSRVLIGGDGGDELFNGYKSQMRLATIYKLLRIPGTRAVLPGLLSLGKTMLSDGRKREIERISALFRDSREEVIFDMYSWLPRHTRYQGEKAFLFSSDECMAYYNSLFASERPEDFLQQIVFSHFRKEMLSDYLRKTDTMAMWNSVEYRVPMLDEDLVQFALSIPFEQKATMKKSKKFLRQLHAEIFPQETSRLKKRGFSVPLDIYLSEKDFLYIKDCIISEKSIVRKYVAKSYIEFLFNALFRKINYERYIHRGSIYQRIIMLYSLHLWAENKL